MRYYKYDGSFETKRDSKFGWWLSDICDDDDINIQQQNRSLQRPKEYRSLNNSISTSHKIKKKNEIVIDKYEPLVTEHVPINVEKLQISLEGYVENNDFKHINVSDDGVIQNLGIENVNYTREKLSNLITTNTLRSRMLMSLIDFPRYKILMSNFTSSEVSIQPIEELKNPSKFFSCDLINEIDNFNKFESTNSNCTKKFKSLESLQENIRNLQLTMQVMKREVICIRDDFREEEKKIIRMIKESKKLLVDLQESTYIDDIIYLLLEQPENVKSINWRFSMIPITDNKSNLII